MDRTAVLSTPAGRVEEVALRFGAQAPLIGVATLPPRVTGPALILFNAGLLHRVGPNRLYVKLARRAAELGHPVLRFDLSGMGDSPPRAGTEDFSVRTREDAQWAIAEMARLCGSREFVTGGLCYGAISGLQVAQFEPRVRGVLMLNPQFINDDDMMAFVEARNLQYWRRTVVQWQRWRDLLTGRADYGMIALRLRGFLVRQKSLEPAAEGFFDDLAMLVERDVRLFQAFGASDVGLDYLELILRGRGGDWQASGRLKLVTLAGSDHLFTPLACQARLLAEIGDWLAALGR